MFLCSQNLKMKENLKKLKPAVDHLRILVIGPFGAGKSSFIQSIKNILMNRISNSACAVAAAGTCLTKEYKTYQFKDARGSDLPFVISDVMGLGKDLGVHPRDIISALKGHIKEGYKFKPTQPCFENDEGYNSCPTVNDKVHCLVFVIPIDTFTANTSNEDEKTHSLLDKDLIKTMQDIRYKACDLGIPHVIILTKVDRACPHVKNDIKHIYRSKIIHQKAQACSEVCGIPMSDVFLVKNYHEEKQLNPDMDAVLLFTLTQILNYANDFVENIKESSSPPADPATLLMETGWRNINWGKNDEMKKNLKKIQPKNPAVDHLRILVIGPIGAGKSSFIQSIKGIFLDRMINTASTVAAGGKNFTHTFTTNLFEDEHGSIQPFVISDVMGLGKDFGVQPIDIINTLNGHIKEGYTFHPVKQCSEKDTGYNSSPTLNEKVHCLVFTIPIDTFTNNGRLDNDLIRMMQNIREKACSLEIPLVVILTKVDEACPHVKEDIKHIYRSKTIYQQVRACSQDLGISMNNIFPVKNYHEEKDLNPDMDAVLLFTLKCILNYANDFVKEMMESEDAGDHSEGTETNSLVEKMKESEGAVDHSEGTETSNSLVEKMKESEADGDHHDTSPEDAIGCRRRRRSEELDLSISFEWRETSESQADGDDSMDSMKWGTYFADWDKKNNDPAVHTDTDRDLSQ
ncbi:uncharacterized protein LOC134081376 isoform X2 [Sardina pilchardus]|uniref:uncharacterized protein LOC134081376 isoform X2 n=1 Tax=Sardina pilchardus TaxID=27697 RepID=UPI002E0D20A4